MRRLSLSAMCAGLALAGCAPTSPPPPEAFAGGPPPVLDAINLHTDRRDGYPFVVPEFHFHAAGGDVVFLGRDVVDTNGPYARTRGAQVNFPSQMQQRGAIYAGGWPCGPNAYYVHMRAYLLDREGRRSNALDYTIHCNGG